MSVHYVSSGYRLKLLNITGMLRSDFKFWLVFVLKLYANVLSICQLPSKPVAFMYRHENFSKSRARSVYILLIWKNLVKLFFTLCVCMCVIVRGGV